MVTVIRDGVLESIVLVRFYMGCNSSVSSDVALHNTAANSSKRSRTRPNRGGDDEKGLSKSEMKKGTGSLVLSHGFLRLIRRFKSFFVYKEGKTKHVEKEMEIGFPTDVKHVAHIGLDGSKWEHHQKSAKDDHQILSLPTISLQQFELAMAAQSNGSSST